MKVFYVYIMASKRNGTIYIGVTNDLRRRVHEHKSGLLKGFSSKYGVHTLVYYEITSSICAALRREKTLKAWNRDWKIKLIEKQNPSWSDVSINTSS